ncbi:MAG TPA: hypothetical protein VNQ90_16645 [Chthoniobacteraceae bacterium]|nr:hypothetical protein [Chthoniobacteraceae bacterium]
MLAFKLFFVVLTAIAVIGGILLLKSFNRVFGADVAVPSENESSRFLNKTQVVVLWLMVVKLLGMMAIIL